MGYLFVSGLGSDFSSGFGSAFGSGGTYIGGAVPGR